MEIEKWNPNQVARDCCHLRTLRGAQREDGHAITTFALMRPTLSRLGRANPAWIGSRRSPFPTAIPTTGCGATEAPSDAFFWMDGDKKPVSALKDASYRVWQLLLRE